MPLIMADGSVLDPQDPKALDAAVPTSRTLIVGDIPEPLEKSQAEPEPNSMGSGRTLLVGDDLMQTSAQELVKASDKSMAPAGEEAKNGEKLCKDKAEGESERKAGPGKLFTFKDLEDHRKQRLAGEQAAKSLVTEGLDELEELVKAGPHKYTSRKRVGDKWVYTYAEEKKGKSWPKGSLGEGPPKKERKHEPVRGGEVKPGQRERLAGGQLDDFVYTLKILTPNELRRRGYAFGKAGQTDLAQAYSHMAEYVSAAKTASESGPGAEEAAEQEMNAKAAYLRHLKAHGLDTLAKPTEGQASSGRKMRDLVEAYNKDLDTARTAETQREGAAAWRRAAINANNLAQMSKKAGDKKAAAQYERERKNSLDMARKIQPEEGGGPGGGGGESQTEDITGKMMSGLETWSSKHAATKPKPKPKHVDTMTSSELLNELDLLGGKIKFGSTDEQLATQLKGVREKLGAEKLAETNALAETAVPHRLRAISHMRNAEEDALRGMNPDLGLSVRTAAFSKTAESAREAAKAFQASQEVWRKVAALRGDTPTADDTGSKMEAFAQWADALSENPADPISAPPGMNTIALVRASNASHKRHQEGKKIAARQKAKARREGRAKIQKLPPWGATDREIEAHMDAKSESRKQAQESRSGSASRKMEGEGQQRLFRSRPPVSLEDMLEKAGGEGARGGVVIGHTASGKPIYRSSGSASQFKEQHSGWSAEDHKDAQGAHAQHLEGVQAKRKPHFEAAASASSPEAKEQATSQLDAVDREHGRHESNMKYADHGRAIKRLQRAARKASTTEKSMDKINSLDDFLAKAEQTMPEGGPNENLATRHTEDGMGLEGAPKPSGSSDSAASPAIDNPKPSKDKLSEDDAEVERQMREHKKPIEKGATVVKSLDSSTGYSREHAEQLTAHADAVSRSRLLKGAADLVPELGAPQPVGDSIQLEKAQQFSTFGGMVQVSNASDLACEQLQKSEGFWHGEAPGVTPAQAPIHQDRQCSCGALYKSYLTACPNCSRGAVVSRVLPVEVGGPLLEKSEGFIGLRPRRQDPDIFIPDGTDSD